jgi:hypothetical protein
MVAFKWQIKRQQKNNRKKEEIKVELKQTRKEKISVL